MFPVELHGILQILDVNRLLDGAVLRDHGAFPLPFTKPLFVDGGVWRAPFWPGPSLSVCHARLDVPTVEVRRLDNERAGRDAVLRG